MPKRSAQSLKGRLKTAFDDFSGVLTVGALKAIRLINRKKMADFAGGFLRRVGPWLPEHRIGRANLSAAFPEKSPEEIETILRGVWDNLGRVAAEFGHLDRIKTYDAAIVGGTWDIDYDQITYDRFHHLRLDGKPALIFTAHLANWELSAQVATTYKLDMTVLYRRPNLGKVADAVINIRKGSMGTLVPTGLDAPVKLMRTLEAGGHVAMLVDQYNVQGVDVTFFGRKTKANPMLARLARHIECPIHGARMIRLPNHRFRIEMTDAIQPARGVDGQIEVQGTMQIITNVVEGWVREHPEQWLWLHRRWR
jgi:Kdo2-lipid IVA lauroyltransferase/acyltransferase